MVGTLGYFVDGRALLSTGFGEQEQSKRVMRRRGILDALRKVDLLNLN